MNIQFSDCQSTVENIILYLMIISILLTIVSGVMLFGNEKLPKNNKGWLGLELLGPLHPLFTKKYLNQRALKWRIPFFASVLVTILGTIFINVFNLCSTSIT